MLECTTFTIEQLNPEPIVQQECEKLLVSGAESRLCVITYPFEQYWLPGMPKLQLTALYILQRTDAGVAIRFTVAGQDKNLPAAVSRLVATGVDGVAGLDQLCAELSLALLSASGVVPLATTCIAKPWGQEIWYTGIEERGVAAATDGQFSMPLPWALSALPLSLCADQQRALILLKILDPLPQPVFGDLYFELHEEKREVYVVTAIDESAWPDGKGGIRFGFDQSRRKQYPSDRAFRDAFVVSVKAYECIRREIDAVVDGFRARDAVAVNAPVAARQLERWLQEVPQALQERELDLRQQMDAYTSQLPLSLGDVVKVPCLTPHSLQHGVRTIEFQTPVYERMILSFAQKVLTQQHWDIDAAAEIMTLDAADQPPHELIINAGGVTVERIVNFHDFEVLRVRLAQNSRYQLLAPAQYGLLIAVEGQLSVAGVVLEPEQAVLLPSVMESQQIHCRTAAGINFLLAYPKG